MTKEIRNEARQIRRASISDGAQCEVCGYSISSVLNLHHKQRVADGGDNSPENLIWLCPTCHNLAHDRASASVRIEKLYLDISDKEDALHDFDCQVFGMHGLDGSIKIQELSEILSTGQLASFLDAKASTPAQTPTPHSGAQDDAGATVTVTMQMSRDHWTWLCDEVFARGGFADWIDEDYAAIEQAFGMAKVE